MPSDPGLWSRIEAFELDEAGAAFNFSARLRRENRWSVAFTRRALAEYRRFLYLACVSPRPVTPSEAVDQAWHLHLVYTRSYWEDLCAGVLGRPLHHGPTRGGAAENEKFDAAYRRTLALYREEFGEEPPADVWPPPAIRFRPAGRWRWVDVETVWILPRPSLRRGLAAAATGIGLPAALIFLTQGAALANGRIETAVAIGAGALVALSVAVAVVAARARAMASGQATRRSRDTGSGGCSGAIGGGSTSGSGKCGGSDSDAGGSDGGGGCGGGCS